MVNLDLLVHAEGVEFRSNAKKGLKVVRVVMEYYCIAGLRPGRTCKATSLQDHLLFYAATRRGCRCR
jgi:hypothetical protein